MDNPQSEIRHEIESTRAGMAEKITALEERLQGAIQDVKRSFDPRYQTERRPWLMTGASLATGYLLGRIVFGRGARKSQVVMPDNWPRGSQGKAGFTQKLTGMLSGVVTAVAVSLAREFASNMITKHYGGERGNSGDFKAAHNQ